MDWRQLVTTLGHRVPEGSVTTYAKVSLWDYGVHTYNQPVPSPLSGAANHGHQRLTNGVVRTDGSLAYLPEGSDQQRRQLLAEGIPFTADGRVDLDRISPVDLP